VRLSPVLLSLLELEGGIKSLRAGPVCSSRLKLSALVLDQA